MHALANYGHMWLVLSNLAGWKNPKSLSRALLMIELGNQVLTSCTVFALVKDRLKG